MHLQDLQNLARKLPQYQANLRQATSALNQTAQDIKIYNDTTLYTMLSTFALNIESIRLRLFIYPSIHPMEHPSNYS